MALWNIELKKPSSSSRNPFSLYTMSLAIFCGLSVSVPVARYVGQLYLHISAHMAHRAIFSVSFLSSAIDEFPSVQNALGVKGIFYRFQQLHAAHAQLLFHVLHSPEPHAVVMTNRP